MAAAVPVPVRMNFAVPPAVEVTVRVALSGPGTVGAKVTGSTQSSVLSLLTVQETEAKLSA